MRGSPLLLIGTGVSAVVIGSAGLFFTTRSTPPLVSLATTTALPSAAPSTKTIGTSTPAAIALPRAAASAAPASLPATGAIARLSIPRLGIRNAPIYDRSTDSRGTMLIAPGYAVTHYAFSAPFGAGNAVLYGHDDIQGNIFGHLYDLSPGDVIQIGVAGQTQLYRVTGHQIVAPSDVAILNPTADNRLTIITCWPFDVDTKRWIVTALKI